MLLAGRSASGHDAPEGKSKGSRGISKAGASMMLCVRQSPPIQPPHLRAPYSRDSLLLCSYSEEESPPQNTKSTQNIRCVQLAGYFGTKFLRFPRLAAQICDVYNVNTR